MPDFHFLLTTRLNGDQQRALETLQQVCQAAGLNWYLTGGPMRDLLTGQPVRMLQVTTEGDPAGLSAALKTAGAEHLSGQHETRSLRLHLHGVRVRIAAARGDHGAGTIIEDLRRRGLTINSIGLSLNPASRYLPLDPTNGAADIEAKLIRMNHPYVFLEDPMVLLRAVRLSTRLEFAIEERTATRMEAAQEGEYLSRATAAAKGQELEAMAYEPDPAAVLRALDKGGWLAAAYGGGVRSGKMNLGALEQLGETIEAWEQLGLHVDAGLAALPFLLGGLSGVDAARLAGLLPSKHLAAWKSVRTDAAAVEKKVLALASATGGGAGSGLKLQELLEKSPAEAVIQAVLDPAQAKAGKRLREFQAEATRLRGKLPQSMLRGLGIAPQSAEGKKWLDPWYRRLLGGESLSEAEITDQVRQAVMASRPLPPETPVVRVGRGRGRRPMMMPAAAPRPAAPAAAPAVAPGPEAKTILAKPAKGAKEAAASSAVKPGPAPAKSAARPDEASKAKPAVKAKLAAKAKPAAKAMPAVKAKAAAKPKAKSKPAGKKPAKRRR